MKKYGLISAVALLVVVNAVVLVGVVRNRSGAPDAVVELTERELPLSYRDSADRENTGISLRLDWNEYPAYGRFLHKNSRGFRYDWFDRAKLEAVGFDCSMPITDAKAKLHYGKMLPKKAFVVLEYDGIAWEAWREKAKQDLADVAKQAKRGVATRKELKEAREEYKRELKTHSRLFAVDAGSNPVKLRQQYPDGRHFLIMPAQVRLVYTRHYNSGTRTNDPPKLSGYISEIPVDNIHVPKSLRSPLDALGGRGKSQPRAFFPYSPYKHEPRYIVILHFGKRYEPWISDIRLIAQSAQ